MCIVVSGRHVCAYIYAHRAQRVNDTSGRLIMALRGDASRWMDKAAGVDVRMTLVEHYS